MDARGPGRQAAPPRRAGERLRDRRPPDPAACGDLPDLSQSELNGDSVNADPTANQPSARYETDGSG